ncbi:peptidase [Rothia sp. HMSC072B03]|uniref:peptidase n=2 Tax=Rothia TaxID=32207 RepID=UPI0008A1B56A|nr:peptidase [Rothia sp. HMSC072B03]OFM99120.1 peptidase [Rothia sp. HMSC072B03]
MTDHRPARAAARYGAVVALAGALVAPGAALTAPTAFADSKLPIGIASDPAASPSATPSAEPSKTADPTQSASPNPTSASPKSTDSKPANPAKANVTISTEKWREGKLVVRGEGFVSNAPGRGAVFAVKFLDALPDEAHQAINPITKKGGNSPANFMATAKEDGTFEVEVSLPTPENTGLTAEQLKNKGWTVEGTSHRIQVLSGSLGGTDANGNTYDRRASVSQNITLSDPAPTAEPTPAPSEDSKTCAPADDSFTPRLTIENPKAVQGGKLHLTGDGWCNPEDKKASVIGLKIDDGKVSRNDATAVNDNRTIWAVITPDENGHVDAWIDLPTRDNAAFKNDEDAAKYASGEHTLRLLTGSLRDGDRSGTYGGANSQGGINTTFTIGEYAPGDVPQPVNASELTNGNGVQVSRDGSTVTVTVPNAEPGTWVYAATYLGNSPQTLYGSGWKRLDDNRSFSYETRVSMPAATYRVVVHNGNQGAENAVLGFADMTVERAAAPREDASDDDLGSYEAEPTLATVVTPAETVVNRVQAKAKEKAPQSTAAKPEAKATAKATSSPSASPRSTTSASASPTALTAQGPTVEGTELTGATKWFVNNANNLLLSAAGLVILALALTSRRTNK